MGKYKNYRHITLDMSNSADVQRLNQLLDELDKTNRVFTVEFQKINGEPRNANAVSVNHSQISGGGTVAMSRQAKRQTGNYVFYELQRTKIEKEYIDELNLQPKELKWKTCKINNIVYIRYGGIQYDIVNNDWEYKDG